MAAIRQGLNVLKKEKSKGYQRWTFKYQMIPQDWPNAQIP